jgi:N-acetylmuramoyl-L-alanine amidase
MGRIKPIVILLFLTQFFVYARGQSLSAENSPDKIVVDAGHGGKDRGAPGTVFDEKDITLAIALLVGGFIQEQMPDVEVIYTRDDDTFVPLHKRAKIANDNHADLFISIHCNSISDPDFFGAETYVMGVHKTAENLEVAKAENAAILLEDDYGDTYGGFDPDSDEDYIMLNMIQNSSLDQSIRFSMLVQQKLKETAGMYDRGVKQAGFVVLYLTTMPGVLIETGFLSNRAEEKYLLNPDNQTKIARAIAEAVDAYREDLKEKRE